VVACRSWEAERQYFYTRTNTALDMPANSGKLESAMEDIAQEYEEQGWDTIMIYPGAITVLLEEYSDTFGLDVLVSRDKFDAVYEVYQNEGFDSDSYELYKRATSNSLYLVVGIQSETEETMILYPSITDREKTDEMLQTAVEHGEMRTRLRPLSKEKIMTVYHSDPELFLPEEQQDESS